jgi:hypothetical protein
MHVFSNIVVLIYFIIFKIDLLEMKKAFAILLIVLLKSAEISAQSLTDAAVQIVATAVSNPPQITLRWPGNASTLQYQVFRKLKSSGAWGAAMATLPSSVLVYTDNSVVTGDNYEYRIIRSGNSYTGYGYCNSGVDVPEVEYRGKLILLVDSTMINPLAAELDRFVEDVKGDGWEVIRHDVLRTGSVLHVKDLILADYALDTTEIKAVFIVGHVPVPYSGNINPDGHSDHLGAWPADVFYGDIDGVWTDISVSSTSASPPRTQNLPNDGKFDQSLVPGDVELQVGRADFAGMSSFTLTEQQLLKNYLAKDHAYRKKLLVPLRRALVDDNFGYFGSEAFAASGYKNFAPLVGTSSITAGDYMTAMSAGSYLWSYGCGGGSYTSGSGIGTTASIASASLQGVFTMLFGSYFGDWDAPNSFLRAPLAQGNVLTNVWSGRPHYQLHHMGLGETIGYGLLLTQNNPGGLYFASPTNITGKWIHNALMGDPTLRNDIVSPVTNVIATRVANNCYISWSASTQSNVIGYHLYMKNDSSSRYVRLNSSPLTSTTYTDNCLLFKGIYSYMVRALVRENNTSGSYYNLSEGIADTAYNPATIRTLASFAGTLTGASLNLTNTSVNGTSVRWVLPGGQVATTNTVLLNFSANGPYQVIMISSNACHSDTVEAFYQVTEVGLSENPKYSLQVSPNPASAYVTIRGDFSPGAIAELHDVSGRLIRMESLSSNNFSMSVKDLPTGLYLLKIKDNGWQKVLPLQIE